MHERSEIFLPIAGFGSFIGSDGIVKFTLLHEIFGFWKGCHCLPLIIQTGAFFKYQRIAREQAYEKIRLLSKRVRNVNGEFWFLVHNSETTVVSELNRDLTPYLLAIE